ncbi:hypothetical protein ABT065_34460 [Streptomyces sp. NPDC002764]|uniref:hypothetical protein n=1 Tax=unclassified Streptomyces TaxID=2593676 RepID=UPI003329BA9B
MPALLLPEAYGGSGGRQSAFEAKPRSRSPGTARESAATAVSRTAVGAEAVVVLKRTSRTAWRVTPAVRGGRAAGQAATASAWCAGTVASSIAWLPPWPSVGGMGARRRRAGRPGRGSRHAWRARARRTRPATRCRRQQPLTGRGAGR